MADADRRRRIRERAYFLSLEDPSRSAEDNWYMAEREVDCAVARHTHEECPVCLDHPADTPCGPCNHHLCYDCIRELHERTMNCPLCFGPMHKRWLERMNRADLSSARAAMRAEEERRLAEGQRLAALLNGWYHG